MVLPTAARQAGSEAARKAVDVFRALQKVCSPAGKGVELSSVAEALPFLAPEQLISCAAHFGQRGRVVGPVAAELAAELGRRLRESRDPGAQALPELVRGFDAKEVTTALYAFSKLSPQLPQYRAFYDAVADGLVQGRWHMEGLRASLVATALVDTETRLEDALPAVLRPNLEKLQGQAPTSIDELRFLAHAAVHLPPLPLEHMQVLAKCTERLLPEGSFSEQAHLTVSWLRLTPLPSAKEVHLNTLEACCKMLGSHKRSFYPAHPLPREGLAPAVEALLAREAEQTAPPITPPVLQNIARGLVMISWGLHREGGSKNPNRSLGTDDWAKIMQMLMAFCEDHMSTKARRSLPVWARETLFHVLWRAQHSNFRHSAAPEHVTQLGSLLALLRLMKQHPPKPEAKPEFFQWAAKVVTGHQQVGSDSVLLMQVVNEVMPFLPELDRNVLARRILSPDAPPTVAIPTKMPEASPRLLAGDTAQVAPVVLRDEAAKPAAAASARPKAGRLWGILASAPATAPAEAEATQATATASHAAKAEVAMRQDLQEPVPAPTPPSVQELQGMLSSALQRVEALETRLQNREEREEAQAAKPLEEASNKSTDHSGSWLTSILSASEQVEPSPAAMTLHLRRSFNFEEFRRAHSARLQTERLRVAVPPDHFPLWPIRK